MPLALEYKKSIQLVDLDWKEKVEIKMCIQGNRKIRINYPPCAIKWSMNSFLVFTKGGNTVVTLILRLSI